MSVIRESRLSRALVLHMLQRAADLELLAGPAILRFSSLPPRPSRSSRHSFLFRAGRGAAARYRNHLEIPGRTREEETGPGPRHQLCACKLPVPRCNASIWWSTIIRTIHFSLFLRRLINRYCACFCVRSACQPHAHAHHHGCCFFPKKVDFSTVVHIFELLSASSSVTVTVYIVRSIYINYKRSIISIALSQAGRPLQFELH